MILKSDTPYKVVKYLIALDNQKLQPKKYSDNGLIIYLEDREYIKEQSPNKFTITPKFHSTVSSELNTTFNRYNAFIKKHDIDFIENFINVTELDALITLDNQATIITEEELSLQEISAKYFKSSKYITAKSNIAKAIKSILKIDEFPEDEKDQQYLSILYPKKETRYIILCENKNRLRMPRHNYIEYWYVGGNNIKQLKFVPKPQIPIYYLFDWDYKGIGIYLKIKEKYIKEIKAFVPSNFRNLMEKREDVKHHYSRWENDTFLSFLDKTERLIASKLIESDSIIEEQKIILTEENLTRNSIGFSMHKY